MPSKVYLVKVGMTMTEGTVDEWYVNDGDQVAVGDLLYRLETEKVNMDVEAETTGIVKLVVEAGTVLAPGELVGWIFHAEETIPDVLPTPQSTPNLTPLEDQSSLPASQTKTDSLSKLSRTKASPAAKRLAKERGIDLSTITGTGPKGRIVAADIEIFKKSETRVAASPAARQLASELDVDLGVIEGTGPRGRITKEDVQRHVDENDAGKNTEQETAQVVAMSGMRRTISQRMFDSLRTTAQLTMDREVNVDALIQARTRLNGALEQSNIHLTYTDFIVAAVARTLKQHSRMNSFLVNGEIQVNTSSNVGIAVALKEGLIVPVIQDAESKSLQEISMEAATLARKARTNELNLDDVSNGTFTVTSLGMYGIDTFTPILNAPQTGILGVGRVYDGVAWINDSPSRTSCLRLSLTWDHRVVDGAPAAEFLRDVSELLESPFRL